MSGGTGGHADGEADIGTHRGADRGMCRGADGERREERCGGSLPRLAELSSAELLRRVVALAQREREATIELIAHLAEIDARRLYLGEGFGSLFAYCTGALRLSEHAAYNRIEAARLSRRFPAILERLADGSLNLSTARLLAPHLEPENCEALMREAGGRSKREVEALVARLHPRADLPASVRRLPAPDHVSAPHTAAPAPSGWLEASSPRPAEVSGPEPAPAPLPPPAWPSPPPVVVPRSPDPRGPCFNVIPLAPERYRVQFTIGAATHENLRKAQDLLRREIPDGDPGRIFDRAVRLLLEQVAREKVGAAARPREGRPTRPRSRHIPARVKRAVWLRDGGRCAFVAPSGRRCGERAFLEFHHRAPHALGGEATVANVALRCRGHNVHEAELVFGPVLDPGPRGAVGRAVREGWAAH